MNTGHFKAGDQPTTGAVVESKPLLARLMSHPAAHTLEHIEKQQRSITPQPSTHHQPQISSSNILATNNMTNVPSSNRCKRRNKALSLQDADGHSIIFPPASISQDLAVPVNQSANDSNGSTGFLRIQSPTNTTPSTLKNHQTSNIINTNNVNPLASLFAHASGNAVRKHIYTYCKICNI